jgi:hypothetical protein
MGEKPVLEIVRPLWSMAFSTRKHIDKFRYVCTALQQKNPIHMAIATARNDSTLVWKWYVEAEAGPENQ